jgi:hypothetical protein
VSSLDRRSVFAVARDDREHCCAKKGASDVGVHPFVVAWATPTRNPEFATSANE